MKTKSLSFVALTLILLLNACSPLEIATSSGQQPVAVETSIPATSGYQPVIVENVEVQVGVGSPIPVEIVVSGTWPSLCSQIAEVQSSINEFQIDFTVLASTVDACPPDLVGLPYRFAIPLNIVEMKDGTYTIAVNGKSTTFDLPADLAKGTGAISGRLWHDQCASGLDGQPVPASTPPGCVAEDSPLGPYHANGILDSAPGSNEGPIEGVVVRLFKGDCASDSLDQVAEAKTIAADVSYSFTGLPAGTYCVYIGAREDVNQGILLPGIWTYPHVSEGDITQTVSLQPGEGKYDVNFGWDHQFK